MRRALLLLTALSACVPTFVPATPDELSVTYTGTTLSLTSDRPVVRGSVYVVAESVTSAYCDPCTPDEGGGVLLRLLEGGDYADVLSAMGLELGAVTGLERVRAAAVRQDERRAVEAVWPDPKKPPGTP